MFILSAEIIEVDGATGESGGQIIRTALTLSAITQKPVKLFNIRKNRPKSGLAMQHLTGAKAVRSICRGELEGAELGSKELTFTPGKIIGGKYEFNIGTAGSVCLVAQTILPILLNAEKKSIVRIKGGTHVIKSPNYDYFENIFLKALNLMGCNITSKLLQTGYYPKGGGEIELTAEPLETEPGTKNKNEIEKIKFKSLKKIQEFPRENFKDLKSIIRLGSLQTHIGVREKKVLVQNGIEKNIRFIEEKTLSPGNCITLLNGLKGTSVLGELGKRAELVAEEALEELKTQLDFDVDYRLADQLLLYYCLIEEGGSYSFSRASNHLKTNAEIIKKFLDKEINIHENKISVN